MAERFNTDEILDRINMVLEYSYYNKPLNEDDEEEQEQPPAEDQETPEGGLEPGDDLDAEFDAAMEDGGDELADQPADMGMEDMGEEEVELDVSEIVDGVNQNKEGIDQLAQKIDGINNNISSVLNKIIADNENLVSQVQQMGANVQKELVKRAPTPNEKLQMVSMNSYPYNQKLSDYWKPASGDEYEYSIDNPNGGDQSPKEDETPEEYVLTQKDIESGYDSQKIRNSF